MMTDIGFGMDRPVLTRLLRWVVTEPSGRSTSYIYQNHNHYPFRWSEQRCQHLTILYVSNKKTINTQQKPDSPMAEL